MAPTAFKTLIFPPAEWGTLSSDELRLRIVEENLLTFLVATLLAAIAMWFFAPSVSLPFMAMAYMPFTGANIVALWLARQGRVLQGVMLYTVTVGVMQAGSILVFGGTPIHVVISVVNLILLVGVAVGAKAALLMTTLTTVLLFVSHLLTDGQPIIDLPVAITPTAMFIATTATLISTGFVVASALRVLWAHVDQSASAMRSLSLARDDLDERHRRALALSTLAQTMLDLEDGDRIAEPLVQAIASMEETESVLVLDGQYEPIESHGDLGVPIDQLRVLLDENVAMQGYRPTRLLGNPAHLYGVGLGSASTHLGFLILRRRGGALLPEGSHIFIAAAARIMVAARLRVDSEERFRRTQRMETLGQFTGGIAHDFNNLLTTILGSAELAIMSLEEEEPSSEAIAEHLAVTRTGALQAGALVSRLLAFAKRSKRDPTRFDLSDYLQTQESFLRRTLGEGIQATFSYSEQALWIHADPIEVQQVILNLLANARTAMSLSGEVEISLTQGHEGHAVIKVADSGPGIPLEDRARIFKAFYTTRDEGGGLGLGLATVSSIVDRIGGKVEVTNSASGGAAFLVHWPLSENDPGLEVGGDTSAEVVIDAGVALIVDDDALVRETIAAMLKALGHQVVQAGGVTEALSYLDSDPSITLIITDFLMPERNGTDLVRTMREQGDRRPVILVSGYEESTDLPKDPLGEPEARMGKPFTLGELRATLSRVLGARADGEPQATVGSTSNA